jgi:hypothetical protein
MKLVPGVRSLGIKLTTYLHLVPRSRKVELYLHSPICLHGIVLNELSTGQLYLYMRVYVFLFAAITS